MPTRRDILTGAIAAAFQCGRVGFAKPSQPTTAVNFPIPAHACDCHTHIIGDPEKFPFWSGRVYTPETALPEEMAALHRALHVERVVIVTPSFYGTDNSATLNGMKARGRVARGIAVIDKHTSDGDLDSMDRAGIRGIRINVATAGISDPSAVRQMFSTAVDRLKGRRWHIQINTTLPVIAGIKGSLQSSPVPVVFDHFGGARANLGLAKPGFADLIELVRIGKCYVKISGAYRSSTQSPDYADMTPFARALISANANRIVWGTDWPHPDSTTAPGHRATERVPLLQIDDGRLLNQLPVWAPDSAIRKKILVDNPARLYGF